MTEFIVKEFNPVPKMTDAVLIEGLPGIGNVARLTVDYLIDKLKAVKLFEVFSDVMPNSVAVTDDSLIKMFSVEFFHVKVNGRDLVFVASDVQPSSDTESYALCKKIIDLAVKIGVKQVITIGGIGLPEAPTKPLIHAVVNDKRLIKDLEGFNLVFDGNDTVKIILGATGLILGLADLNGLSGFSLLVETLNQSQYVGIAESREVLVFLTKFLNFNLDFSELDSDIKDYEADIKAESNQLIDSDDSWLSNKHGYIG